MEMALMSEDERVWGGEWWGGLEKLRLDGAGGVQSEEALKDGEEKPSATETERAHDEADADDGVEGDESLPPQFDLRTGKLVSHSRPMRLTESSSGVAKPGAQSSSSATRSSEALVKRTVGELASINGVASPGAEFLLSKRTWQGLGSDFDNEASTVVEEGRSGIARGYGEAK
jgi:diphthamide biosynthesis protein 2